MNLLISLIVATGIAYYGKNIIRKHASWCYIGTIGLAAASTYAYIHMAEQSVFLNQQIFYIASIYTGALATAFFIIVMYVGAVPKGHWIMKNFMGIRGQLSIIGSILVLVHNISMYYFSHGIMDDPDAPIMIYRVMSIFTLLMFIILVPLFITSFVCVRKKMHAKKWKKLQRWAYVYYALIYVHVMIGNVPFALQGYGKNIVNVGVYSAVFITYAVMRIRKHKKK